MTVAIHQPNFLPWMGYFYKISLCDNFVFFETAQYTQPSFIRRVKIHKANNLNDEKYLIVQLQKHSNFDAIDSLQVKANFEWQQKIKAQIHHAYHKAPYYHQLFPIVDQFFCTPLENLSFSNYAIEIIQFISGLLNIHPKWEYASVLNIKSKAGDANIEMCHKVGGTHYLSGYGAKKYQTIDDYKKANLKFKYTNFLETFETSDIPVHFKNKSIISYLAYYDIELLKEKFFQSKIN
ncbi:MAG: WbqC family protein [Saprospiraceae bacterium]